jgi:LAO/AO transport system kinase
MSDAVQSKDAAQKIRSGDLRALARAATGVENRDPEALALLREMEPFAGHALVIGVTGPPGAGKSTLVDAMAAGLRRQGKTVAVIAIDPTSRITGGAILGDRIRMQRHHGDSGVFVRSMATRGTSGGLARATADLAQLMDGAGRDYVIIETVGVGQDEVDIAKLAQVTVVVLVPGLGDDVQAIKAGIMEIADVFAINKADLPGADKVEREIHAASDRPIVKTVATDGTGVAELLEKVAQASWPAHPEPRGLPQPIERRPTPDPRPPSIDHIGIAVNDLEKAVQFYESIGLKVERRETVETEKVHVAMLPTPDSRIELLEPAALDSPISKFLDKRGPGLHHIALRVPDLDAALVRLRKSGARLLNEPRAGAGGHRYVFIHPASTEGVLLELIQESST